MAPQTTIVQVDKRQVAKTSSTNGGLPGVSTAEASLCAQAGLASGCFTADARHYGYPVTLYSADADLLYESIEEYADAYDHRFDIAKDLALWFLPPEGEGDVQLAGAGTFGRAAVHLPEIDKARSAWRITRQACLQHRGENRDQSRGERSNTRWLDENSTE